MQAVGRPWFFNAPGFEFVDVPEEKKIYILDIAGPHSWRVVYMDGRPHPPAGELRPTYLGHSIGRWDGDTLVVDSVGFNEKQWVVGSYPTSEQLHMTERISRPNTENAVVRDDDRRSRRLHPAVVGPLDDHRSDGFEVDRRRRDVRYICQDSR